MDNLEKNLLEYFQSHKQDDKEEAPVFGEMVGVKHAKSRKIPLVLKIAASFILIGLMTWFFLPDDQPVSFYDSPYMISQSLENDPEYIWNWTPQTQILLPPTEN